VGVTDGVGVGVGVTDGDGEGVPDGEGDGVTDGVGVGVTEGVGVGDALTVNCNVQRAFPMVARSICGAVGAAGWLPRFSSNSAIDTTAMASTIVRIVPPRMSSDFSRRWSIGLGFAILSYSIVVHSTYS